MTTEQSYYPPTYQGAYNQPTMKLFWMNSFENGENSTCAMCGTDNPYAEEMSMINMPFFIKRMICIKIMCISKILPCVL